MARYCSVKTNGEKHIEDVLRSKLVDVTEIKVNDISGMITLKFCLLFLSFFKFFFYKQILAEKDLFLQARNFCNSQTLIVILL